MMSKVEQQAMEQMKALAKARGQPKISIELYDWYTFQHVCQGQVNLTYKVSGILYEKGDPSFIPEEYNLPEAIMTLSVQELGSVVHSLDDVRRDKQIADEMTDSLCQKAQCNNGEDCVLKRKSR